MTEALSASFDELLRAVATSAQYLRDHPVYQEDENRPAAYAFLASMLIARLEEHVIFDPDFPYFRVLDPRIREGGDNPDQRYLIARINGGDTYRVWGSLGPCRRLDLQIYAGDPYIAGSGGRAASFLTFEQIDVGAHGDFEIVASPSAVDGNWIENPPDATRVLVRQVYGDWSSESPGHVHIDRIGHEGDAKPVLDAGALSARLRTAAADLSSHVRVWPEMVQRNYVASGPPNHCSPLFDPGSVGGVPGRWMGHAVFDLAPDEALVIRTWPADGNYQGVQLADLWFSSLEYANRQTSLTADQAHRSGDGSFWFVVSRRDPEVPNWLDTVGRRRGVVLFRYDGTRQPIDASRQPVATVVRLSELRTHLPADTPTVTADERRAALARRRRHVQLRFGN